MAERGGGTGGVRGQVELGTFGGWARGWPRIHELVVVGVHPAKGGLFRNMEGYTREMQDYVEPEPPQDKSKQKKMRSRTSLKKKKKERNKERKKLD